MTVDPACQALRAAAREVIDLPGPDAFPDDAYARLLAIADGLERSASPELIGEAELVGEYLSRRGHFAGDDVLRAVHRLRASPRA